MKYEGEIVEGGVKDGKGIEYNKDGFKLFEGYFIDNKRANGFGKSFKN